LCSYLGRATRGPFRKVLHICGPHETTEKGRKAKKEKTRKWRPTGFSDKIEWEDKGSRKQPAGRRSGQIIKRRKNENTKRKSEQRPEDWGQSEIVPKSRPKDGARCVGFRGGKGRGFVLGVFFFCVFLKKTISGAKG